MQQRSKQKIITLYCRAFFTSALLCAVLLSACNKEAVNSPGADLSEPIISTGDFFKQSNWNDPHVLFVDNKFVMYASASQNLDQNIKIYRMESNDGVSWKLAPTKAVFERSSNKNEWDSKSVETPAVVYFQGKYHLFYIGYSTVYSDALNFKIGHCVSNDGITWQRAHSFLLKPNHPVGLPNYTFNQYIVGEPGPVVVNNKLHLYFTTVGYDSTLKTTTETIGLTVFDGSKWSAAQQVLVPDQKQYPRAQYVGYSTPNAIVRNGKVHLFVDVVHDNPWQQVKLHRAVSDDGISNWVNDSVPVLSKEMYSWTLDEIRSPSALEHNGKLYLYFAGHTGINLCIGLKILE